MSAKSDPVPRFFASGMPIAPWHSARWRARERSRVSSDGSTPLRTAVSYLVFPVIMVGSLGAAAWGVRAGYDPYLIATVNFVLLLPLVHLLEWKMPFERKWLQKDGQFLPDLLHAITGFSAPIVVNVPVLAGSVWGAGWLADRMGGAIWPHGWPFWAQIVLLFVCSEFVTYWLHRSIHEVHWLWRFHAIHHSAPRLWWMNTARIHVVDVIWNTALSLPLPILMGCPSELLFWPAIFGLPLGVLSHSNFEMRCGFLNYVFNTPEVHRWHHSRIVSEGNNNYGPLLVLWDQVFGTFFLPPRRPPLDVGADIAVPQRFLPQLTQPFTRKDPGDRRIRPLPPRETAAPGAC